MTLRLNYTYIYVRFKNGSQKKTNILNIDRHRQKPKIKPYLTQRIPSTDRHATNKTQQIQKHTVFLVL